MREISSFRKLLILTTLSLVGSAYAVLLRYSRVVDKLDYISTTVVALQETIKFAFTILVLIFESGGLLSAMNLLKHHVFDKPKITLAMAAPSCLYTLQNNMIFVALANMNVPTQQVLFQLKIPFTAILCVVFLGKSLTRRQWLAVFMIFAGTGVIQYQSPHHFHKSEEGIVLEDTIVVEEDPIVVENESFVGYKDNFIVGFTAVMIASLCSALAGVCFEKMIKTDDSSIWIRNMQMYIWSVPVTFLTVLLRDRSRVNTQGFFFDYAPIVWILICMSSAGGILVSIVLLYTDNVTKSFAASTSLVLSTLASCFLFDYHIGLHFICGMLLVCFAIYIYSGPTTSHSSEDAKNEQV